MLFTSFSTSLNGIVIVFRRGSDFFLFWIEVGLIGRVKVKNTEWSAVSNELVEVGSKVRVLDIEGVKLIVEKI